jgi:NDP-sugar pyrophosphorylase family protein
VKLGAIVVIGATGEIFSPENSRISLLNAAGKGKNALVGEPLACVEIAGRSMTERTIERLLAAGVENISILVTEKAHKPEFRARFDNVRVQVVSDVPTAIREQLNAYAQAEIEHCFVSAADAYAETDLLDLFYFHREARQAVTSTFDRHGALALWVVACGQASEPNFEISMGRSAGDGASYFIREYVNRLNHPRDLRQFAEDTLRGRCESRPSGKQIRPGVWMDEKADVHRKARVVAPAYIGRGSEIRAEAVVTRFSSIEKDCCVDCGTVVEDSSILANTNVGIWLDVCHAVVSGKRLLSLSRDVTVEISDPTIMRQGSSCATNSTRKRNKPIAGVTESLNEFKKEHATLRFWQ